MEVPPSVAWDRCRAGKPVSELQQERKEIWSLLKPGALSLLVPEVKRSSGGKCH